MCIWSFEPTLQTKTDQPALEWDDLGVALEDLGVALEDLGVAWEDLGVVWENLGVVWEELGVEEPEALYLTSPDEIFDYI